MALVAKPMSICLQGYHEGALPWPHRPQQQTVGAAVAATSAALCQETQQQVFLSSSGMRSSLLHRQQQQVTQLLHAPSQTCKDHIALEVQQHDHIQQGGQSHHQLHCQQDATGSHHVQQPDQHMFVSSYHDDDHHQQQQHYHLQPGIAWHLDVEGASQKQQHLQDDADVLLQQQQHVQQADQWQRLLLLRHPSQFTGWIKRCSSLDDLQQLYDLHGSRLNPINLSAALVQLGRLYGGIHGSSKRKAAQRLALQLAEQLQQQLDACDSARQVANASWALAVLQCSVPDTLLQRTAQQVSASDARLLRASQPQELATLAWAFSKLQLDPCHAVWSHITAALQQHQLLSRLKPQELAMLLWALGDRQQRQQELLPAVPVAVNFRQQEQQHVQALRRHSGDSAAIAVPSSKQRSLGLRTLLPLLSTNIQQQLQHGRISYSCQDLSLLLGALANLRFTDQPLLQALSARLQQQIVQGRCNSKDISNSIWALSKLQVEHPGLLAAAVQTADSWLIQCSSHDLLLTLYAVAASAGARPTAATAIQHQHAADLWLQAASELQQRLAAGQQLGPAELTTLLQAVERTLQGESVCNKRKQRVSCFLQSASAPRNGDEVSSVSSSLSSSECLSSSEDSDSVNSRCEAVTDVAKALLTVVYNYLVLQPDLIHSLGWRHIACVLSALASISDCHQRPPAEVVAALLRAARAAATGMNHQQLSMTAWAAAKLAPSNTADEPTELLMDTLQETALDKLHRMQPHQLSALAWAHARLWNLGDSLLLHELARAATKQLHRFGPQALSNLTWAFARARHYDGALTAALARRGRTLLEDFSPAELSNLVWGLVTLGCRQQGFLRAVATHAVAHCSSWDAKACTKLADAFSHDGVPVQRFRGLFYALGDALADKPGALVNLTVHELAQLAVAFSVARVRHKQLVGHVAAAAVQRLERMAVADIVRLVSAVASLNQRHDGLLAAVSARVAAEMAWKSEVGAGADSSSNDDGTASTSHNDDPPVVASAGKGLSNSKLQPQHLSRLAWAYKTLRHEDADWYQAAAEHMSDVRDDQQCRRQQQQEQADRRHWMKPSSLDRNASSCRTEPPGCSRGAAVNNTQAGYWVMGTAERHQQQLGDDVSCSMLRDTGSTRRYATNGSHLTLLQRPVHRPESVSSATALVQVRQQTERTL